MDELSGITLRPPGSDREAEEDRNGHRRLASKARRALGTTTRQRRQKLDEALGLHRAAVAALAIGASSVALANDELMVMQNNPAEWVMPNGNYASTRYSTLSQINKDNVGDLQVAWTFSTGVLRGHEGGPLVIGDVMYIHTPFPNIVYALDLNDDGRVIWKYEPKQDPNVIPVMCCDTVNRGVAYGDGKIFLYQADTTLVALDAKTGKVALAGQERRSRQGRDRHLGAAGLQGQGLCRHLRRRVRRPGPPDRLQHRRRQAGLARLLDRARRP